MEEYVGIIKIFAGTYAPRGWMFCQGQMLNIQQNQALFSLISNKYGGDGVTTFALPDLRGTTAIGVGTSPISGTVYQWFQKGGVSNIQLSSNNIPSHTHSVTASVTLNCNMDGTETNEPAGNYLSISDGNAFSGATPAATGSDMLGVTNTLAMGNAGSSSPITKLMPYMALNYIICVTGYYPPRN